MARKLDRKHENRTVYASDYSSAVKDINKDARTVTLRASSADGDRDGDTIKQSGWVLDNYVKNPAMLWAHDYKSVPIARASLKI